MSLLHTLQMALVKVEYLSEYYLKLSSEVLRRRGNSGEGAFHVMSGERVSSCQLVGTSREI